MNATEIESLIRENVGTEELAAYLTAPSGDWLGVYADGSVSVGESVGDERDPEERPVIRVACPGLDNLDMTWWREGWDSEGVDDGEVVRTCCRDGDVSGELDDLIAKLIAKLDEQAEDDHLFGGDR